MAVNCRVEAKKIGNGGRASIQGLLRAFKNACEDAEIMQDYKDHEFFIRKSDKNRKKKLNKIRAQREAQENQFTNKIEKVR